MDIFIGFLPLIFLIGVIALYPRQKRIYDKAAARQIESLQELRLQRQAIERIAAALEKNKTDS